MSHFDEDRSVVRPLHRFADSFVGLSFATERRKRTCRNLGLCHFYHSHKNCTTSEKYKYYALKRKQLAETRLVVIQSHCDYSHFVIIHSDDVWTEKLPIHECEGFSPK